MKHYPCDIKAGDLLVMKDGRKYKIKLFDGRFIKTLEGVTIRPKHVDIKGFEEDVAVKKASESVSEEETQKKTKGRKRKEESEEVTEEKTEEE